MISDSQVEAWVREDVGHHDVTNQLPGKTTGHLIATECGVAAGLDAATAVFEYLGVAVTDSADAGDRINSGENILAVEGPVRDVLRGERVAVNIAAHASGVATQTRRAVEAARAESDDVQVAGTRKTTPGLRGVEKRAVAAGGGDTHRLNLSHMVMVKDNHIAEVGLEPAIKRLRERTSFATNVEVEIETPMDVPRAAKAGADIVLLDNMDPDTTAVAVDRLHETATECNRTVLVEASGGITIETVPHYAATGVDIISLGSLTHSAPALDLSFRMV